MKLVTKAKNGIVTSLVMSVLNCLLRKHLSRFDILDKLTVVYLPVTASLFDTLDAYYEDNHKPANVIMLNQMSKVDAAIRWIKNGGAINQFSKGNALVIIFKDKNIPIGAHGIVTDVSVLGERLNQKAQYLKQEQFSWLAQKLIEIFSVSFVSQISLSVRGAEDQDNHASLEVLSYYGLIEKIYQTMGPALHDVARLVSADNAPNVYAVLLEKGKEIEKAEKKSSVSRPTYLAAVAIEFIAFRPEIYGDRDWSIDQTDNITSIS